MISIVEIQCDLQLKSSCQVFYNYPLGAIDEILLPVESFIDFF